MKMKLLNVFFLKKITLLFFKNNSLDFCIAKNRALGYNVCNQLKIVLISSFTLLAKYFKVKG